jgi:benzoyl-CoA reductase/2-hydroxyglutaryl-CoA dehydratase subunit BcrC/BadD/HgdB
MKTIEDLSIYLKERVAELLRLKKQGVKIIGYVPGGFVPEELIWAGGAIPAPLNRGGDHEAVLKSIEFMPRVFDTYSRCQIGYWALGEPLYRMGDLMVVPCTDKNIQAIGDCWEMWTETKLFRLGVPHNNTTEHAFRYYLEELHSLKGEIEKLTGNQITEARLREEIKTADRMRFLLRQISETRKSEAPPISGSDFIKLHHASFLADRNYMVRYLESLSQELKDGADNRGPRVFLIGSSIAEGDYKIYELLESAGANVVMEDFSEGMRPYWQQVESDGDLIQALADAYFRKRALLPAFFRPSGGRLSILLKLAREYKVDGIICYTMLYRESHEIEGIHFGRLAEKEGFKFLRVTSDYDNAEYEGLRTRIEAFVESMKEGKMEKKSTKRVGKKA